MLGVTDYITYFSQLPEDNQKHIRRCVKMISLNLRQAESRLRGYESEKAEAETCTVFKTINDLKEAIALTEALLSELVKAHELPPELGILSDEYRKYFRDALTNLS